MIHVIHHLCHGIVAIVLHRTITLHCMYQNLVPFVPSYRTTRTIIPYHPYHHTVPSVPSYRTNRTIIPYTLAYHRTVPYVPSSKGASRAPLLSLDKLIYLFSLRQFIWEYTSGKGKSTYIFVFN